MKLIRAARFAGIALLIASLYTFFLLRPGLAMGREWPLRQEWLSANGAYWRLGGWLWLLSIFAWMVLLVSLVYTYTPVHRITTMLQNGLLLIAAVLLILGVIVWMSVLPDAANGDWASFVDGLALTLLGAGLFMGGAVTAWMAADLATMGEMPWLWASPGIGAGLLALPSPFLLPQPLLLVVGLVSFLGWCLFLGSRRKIPRPFPEMPSVG